MSDEKIERVIRKELDGVTDLDERFHVVAGMVDWDYYPVTVNGYRVIPWNPDSMEMSIPVEGCYFGVSFPTDCAIIQFNDNGVIQNIRRGPWPDTRMSYSCEQVSGTFGPKDPWNDVAPQIGPTTMFFKSIDGLPVQREVSSEFPNANRHIGVVYRTSSDSEELITGEIRISTDPPTEYVMRHTQNVRTYKNSAGGAYIVQNRDFAVRSKSSFNIEPPSFQFAPQYVTKFLTHLVLAPHDGVEISVGLVPVGDDE